MTAPKPALKDADGVWAVGRYTIQPLTQVFTRLRVYGKERVPLEGGVVLALNHVHWVDPPVAGAASPRTVYFLAKQEIHRVPGLGQLIRAFGTFSVRRGASDRDAVRMMRDVVHDGKALGLFVEGTRQKAAFPGEVLPGAAMAALQGDVPVVCGAIYGAYKWKPGKPVSLAWGEPMRFDGLPKGGRGYREASHEIQREIRELWRWLEGIHAAGRPKQATPPA
jgi:1-acyl-sn-glycerol-3-phosphate acyltransferase